MKHLMVDLETLGTESNSVILSIGAVFFDLDTGKLGAEYTRAITIKSCLDANLKINARTAVWWMRQEDALKNWANSLKLELREALSEFAEFIAMNSLGTTEELQVWGNSNRFDLGILSDAYNVLQQDIPWNFRKERDVRTLVSYGEDIKTAVVKEAEQSGATLHDPLIDAKLQVKYCHRIHITLGTCKCPPIDTEDGVLNT